MPQIRAPMVVEHAKALPEGADWEYEYSWSGERVFAAKDGESVRITSALQRRELVNRFPVLAAAIAKLNAGVAVIDGVIRGLEPVQFALFAGGPENPPATSGLRFIAVDLLWLDAIDVRQVSLTVRRQRLVEILRGTGVLVPLSLAAAGANLVAEAVRVGADGVLAKRRGSRYRPFARSGDWVQVNAKTSPANPAPGSAPGSASGSPWGADSHLGGNDAVGVGQMA